MKRAQELALKVYEILPKSPDVADTVGWVYLKGGAYVMARPYFDDAINARPKFPIFHYHRGMLYYLEKNNPRARSSFQRAVELGIDLDDPAVDKKLIKQISDPNYVDEEKNKDFQRITSELDQALKNQQYDRVITLAGEARKIKTNAPDVTDKLGWAYYNKGSYLMAKKYINEAISKKSGEPLFHYHLGIVSNKEGKPDNAVKMLEKAVRMGLSGEELKDAEKLIDEIKSKN